ncbi:MAG: trypsin-like serine protease [Acidimicrobiales bacterium]|nr:trypsin-like serine protease [Acidimicrobiales bacterium]
MAEINPEESQSSTKNNIEANDNSQVKPMAGTTGEQGSDPDPLSDQEVNPKETRLVSQVDVSKSHISTGIYVALVALLIGALSGGGITWALYSSKAATVATFSPNKSVISTPSQSDVHSIISQVEPSIVSIATNNSDGSSSQGSGMIITSTGLVLTNNHVIATASNVMVSVYGNQIPWNATIIGRDPVDDLALLSLTGATGLPTVKLGNSLNVSVGESVLAIGNALGLEGGLTVTEGIVSALGRTVPAGEISAGINETLTDMIQTDAAINPGNSGGPLVDMNGNVIGMNTASGSSSNGNVAAQNIGFAIPTSTIESLLPQHQKGGVIQGGISTIGVQSADLSDQLRAYYGIGPVPNYGAVIVAFTGNSPAQSNGLKIGDVITAIDLSPITSSAQLNTIIDATNPGTSITVTYYDQGVAKKATLVVARK